MYKIILLVLLSAIISISFSQSVRYKTVYAYGTTTAEINLPEGNIPIAIDFPSSFVDCDVSFLKNAGRTPAQYHPVKFDTDTLKLSNTMSNMSVILNPQYTMSLENSWKLKFSVAQTGCYIIVEYRKWE